MIILKGRDGERLQRQWLSQVENINCGSILYALTFLWVSQNNQIKDIREPKNQEGGDKLAHDEKCSRFL